MSDVSKLKPNGASGTEYDIKDAVARWQLRSTQTASGNPITLTDCAPINAESLKVTLQPKQEGSGDPSPTNIRTITGYTQTSVEGCGKNRMDFAGFLTASNQSFTENDSTFTIPLITNEVLGWYEFSDADIQIICSIDDLSGTANNPRIEFRQNGSLAGIVVNATNKQITVTCSAFRMNYSSYGSVTVAKPMIRLASESDATFEPYQSTSATIQFGQTVYGGTVDFEGGTDEEYSRIDLGSLTWSYRGTTTDGLFSADLPGYAFKSDIDALCEGFKYIGTVPTVTDMRGKNNGDTALFYSSGSESRVVYVIDTDYSDATEFKTAVTGIYLVFEKATPTTLPTAPADLALLKGTNNLSADGVMELGYQPDNVIGELKGEIQDLWDYILSQGE